MKDATLHSIEFLALVYSERRAILSGFLHALERELAGLKKRHQKQLQIEVRATAEAKAKLHAAIESAPGLFERPKTRVLHGIKVGYRKGPGGLDWEDDDRVVERLKEQFGKKAVDYLIVKEKPSAEALEDLDAAVLKKLGVTVEDTGEQVVVKAVETDLERLVKTLLKGAGDDAEGAA